VLHGLKGAMFPALLYFHVMILPFRSDDFVHIWFYSLSISLYPLGWPVWCYWSSKKIDIRWDWESAGAHINNSDGADFFI
jgi:hypothetical protein